MNLDKPFEWTRSLFTRLNENSLNENIDTESNFTSTMNSSSSITIDFNNIKLLLFVCCVNCVVFNAELLMQREEKFANLHCTV